jgi:hypothetical protein
VAGGAQPHRHPPFKGWSCDGNRSFTLGAYVVAMATYVIRVWLPDRPGALGAVASRIGAVGGDVVAIDILERGAGRAIDELVVDFADEHVSDGTDLVPLMVNEMQQVDGVDVEEVRPMAEALRDPRLDALETAALLVGASSPDDAIDSLCWHAVRAIGAEWGTVVSLDPAEERARQGEPPPLPWVLAFVAGSQSSARVARGAAGPDDVVWSPLPAARMALVLGRSGTPFRARERRQAAALARIVDSRFRELVVATARQLHPSAAR